MRPYRPDTEKGVLRTAFAVFRHGDQEAIEVPDAGDGNIRCHLDGEWGWSKTEIKLLFREIIPKLIITKT